MSQKVYCATDTMVRKVVFPMTWYVCFSVIARNLRRGDLFIYKIASAALAMTDIFNPLGQETHIDL